MKPIRVMIVNNSLREREILFQALRGHGELEIVDHAVTPDFGLIKARNCRPDIFVADIHILGTGTPALVRMIRSERPEVGFLLTTSAAPQPDEAACAVEALESGAADYVTMPELDARPERIAEFGNTLSSKIHIFFIRAYSRLAKSFSSKTVAGDRKPPDLNAAALPRDKKYPAWRRYKLLTIGLSTGGPDALSALLPSLPADFPIPVVVVLHMPPNFTHFMAGSLDKRSELTVREARDGDVPEPGTVYMAPGGRHLAMRRGPLSQPVLAVLDDEPVNNCRPSVDVFFNSVAEVCGKQCIAAILTGMGNDGTEGMISLKKAGAKTVAQDENSSMVWGMPGAAVKAGCVDDVVSLERLPEHFLQLISTRA